MSDSVLLECGEGISDGGSSDSETISCTCGAEGRAHKRDCPLSSRNRMSGPTLFPAPSEPEAHTEPSKLEPDVSSPQKTISTENVKPAMKVGDYVCIHSRSTEGFTFPVALWGSLLAGISRTAQRVFLTPHFPVLSLFQ